MIYLASKSPRRKELLEQMGVSFTLLIPPENTLQDEPELPNEHPADYVIRTAQDKALIAEQYRRELNAPSLPILSADTVVIVQDRLLRKPSNEREAFETLKLLSGSEHEVHTALTLYHEHQCHHELNITKVFFRHLDDKEIYAYCQKGEPYDKAGAYGIQGLAGIFIEKIIGSYTGVMGLPIYETAKLLKIAKIDIL